MTAVSLAGKVAIITGASSGIGRATSILFSKLGAKLSLVGRNENNLIQTVNECESHGSEVLPIVADLTQADDIGKVVPDTIERFSNLNILVNNAGIIKLGSIENTTMEEFDHMMNVNLRSVVQLTKSSLPYLESTKGSIVNVSSVNGIRAFPGVFSYNISKAAVDQMTRCVALEMASKGIRVNCVNPGVIVTELQKRGGLDDEAYKNFLERAKTTHALGRPGHPDEAAQTIAFLASDAASFITGVSLPVDGGRHAMCPR